MTSNIKKIEHPYVEPKVEDAQTIELETQAENDEFVKLKQEFDKVNDAAKEQKSQTDAIDLIDYILDENNPFKNSLIFEDIWIEDDFFDNKDSQVIKETSKEIINDVIFDDIDPDSFETIETPDNLETISISDNSEIIPDNLETIDIPDNIPDNLDIKNLKTIPISLETEDIRDNIPNNLETIKTFKDIETPSINNLAIDEPKTLKIISNPNSLRIASNKIKKKNTFVKNQKVN